MRNALKRLPRLPLRTWYMMALLVMLFVYDFTWSLARVPMIMVLFPFGCAVAYVAVQSYKGKLGAKNWLLLLISACFVLGAFRTRDLTPGSLYFLGGMLTSLLSVGIVPEDTTPDELRREMLTLAWTLIVIMLPLMILSVLSVFLNYTFRLGNGIMGLQSGKVQDRIYILAHPNIGGRRAEMCVLFAIYALYYSKKRWQRVVLWLTIVVAVMAIAHSQTRSCTLTMGMIFGALMYRKAHLLLREKKWRVPAALVSGAAVAVMTVAAIEALFWIDIHIAVNVLPIAQAEELGISRSVTQGMFNVSGSGRTPIWDISVAFLKAHPSYLLIGTGTGDVTKLMAEEFPRAASFWHLHNSFLEILVRGGIPALACSVVLLVLLVRPCYQMLIAPETDGDRGAYILPVIIGSMLAMTFTESMLFIRPTVINLIFFFAVGRVALASRRKSIGKIQ